MATKNPRINITLEPAVAGLVNDLAHEGHVSVSTFARELIIEALERREDRALSALAEGRDTKGRRTVSHSDAWK